jgi:hypothetical protein
MVALILATALFVGATESLQPDDTIVWGSLAGAVTAQIAAAISRRAGDLGRAQARTAPRSGLVRDIDRAGPQGRSGSQIGSGQWRTESNTLVTTRLAAAQRDQLAAALKSLWIHAALGWGSKPVPRSTVTMIGAVLNVASVAAILGQTLREKESPSRLHRQTRA